MNDKNKWSLISVVVAMAIVAVIAGVCLRQKTPSQPPVMPSEVPGAPSASSLQLAGSWQDSVSQRATMDITPLGGDDYAVLISWSSSASETTSWTFSGHFDQATKRLDYTDATKTNLVFADDGTEETSTVVGQNGTGALIYEDGKLRWQDDEQEADSPQAVFELVGGTELSLPPAAAGETFMGYTPAEVEQAETVIQEEFARFGEGFELHSLDPMPERNNQTELDYINSLERGTFTHVMVVASSFHTPTADKLPEITAWEPDLEYTYDWYLGRTDDGEWQLVTYGY